MRKALNIPLEEFLRPFFGPGERICLRIFDDRKTGTFKGAKLETSLSGLPGLMDTLKKHNEKNRGIYFVVNFGGHEDSEIARINAQFMECDELPLDENIALARGADLSRVAASPFYAEAVAADHAHDSGLHAELCQCHHRVACGASCRDAAWCVCEFFVD